MAFIDGLAVMLLLTGLSAIVVAMYLFLAARGKKDFSMLVAPAFIFGLFDAVSGFLMSFSWPLPGAFNMLFGDPLLVFGLILIAGAYMIHKKMDVKLLSIFGVFLGIYIAIEAAAILNFNLETGVHLITSMGFYIVSALAALFSPLVFVTAKNKIKYAYYFLFALFVLSAFAALFLGYTSIYSHLQSPP